MSIKLMENEQLNYKEEELIIDTKNKAREIPFILEVFLLVIVICDFCLSVRTLSYVLTPDHIVSCYDGMNTVLERWLLIKLMIKIQI